MSISGENLVEAIKASAQSELGIIALIIISMSVVGVILFRTSSDAIKLIVFLTLILGVCGFSYSTMQTLQRAEPLQEKGLSPSNETPDPVVKKTPTLPDKKFAENKNNTQGGLPPVQADNIESITLEEGFVFLGTFRNGVWSDPRFESASGELNVGDILTLTDDRKMFTCAPYRKSMFSLTYTFCNEVVGETSAGEKIRVLKKPVLIGLNRAWVYVQEVKGTQ